MQTRFMTRVVVLGAVAALSLSACATNGGGPGGEAGSTDLVISTDLPLQGASATQSNDTNKLIQLYLDQVGSKAGKYNITLKTYDDSTAAKGAWDDATCAKNANDHVANTNEVAVMGTLQLRLRQDRGSDAQPGPHRPHADGVARQHQPRSDQEVGSGEPDKYYPTGTRNYARVVPPTTTRARLAPPSLENDLKATKAFVLNDNQTYGLGVAKAFADRGEEGGHGGRRRAVLGRQAAQLHRLVPVGEGLGGRPRLPRRHL